MKDDGGMKRREFLKSSFGAVVILQSRPQPDLVLTNGKFVDGRGVVGSTMTIRNGRIARVGQAMQLAPDSQRIDLGGRTVIPGFFDAHVHYTRAGLNPGYEARRIERAFSIAELQEAIARRAESVPAGQFITCIGGWNHAVCRSATADKKRSWTQRLPHPIYIPNRRWNRSHYQQSRTGVLCFRKA
jgi:predicted amidohydrolase YtcJ